MATIRALHSSWVIASGPRRVLEAETDLRRRIRLAALVDGGVLVVPDADRDEAPDVMGRGRQAYALCHFVQNAVADGPAVEQAMVFHAPRYFRGG